MLRYPNLHNCEKKQRRWWRKWLWWSMLWGSFWCVSSLVSLLWHAPVLQREFFALKVAFFSFCLKDLQPRKEEKKEDNSKRIVDFLKLFSASNYVRLRNETLKGIQLHYYTIGEIRHQNWNWTCFFELFWLDFSQFFLWQLKASAGVQLVDHVLFQNHARNPFLGHFLFWNTILV